MAKPSLKVDRLRLYDSEYRQKGLYTIQEGLKQDERILGALLVGSGAIGFKDEYSDLDIAVLVEEEELNKVYLDWETRIPKLLPVIEHFKDPPKHLYGFLFDRFLEFDISFQSKSTMYARRPHWRILFDKRDLLPQLMKPRERAKRNFTEEHGKRISESWYWVIHCITSIQRCQLLRATYFINRLRDETVLMAGLNCGIRTGIDDFYGDADSLPEEKKQRILQTYPASLEPPELIRALKANVNTYYSEAALLDQKYGLKKASTLAHSMREYLEAFSS